MNRREFVAATTAAAALPALASIPTPAIAGSRIDQGDFKFLQIRSRTHGRTWKYWREGMDYDDAYERAMIEIEKHDEAVLAFIMLSFRREKWDYTTLRHPEDVHLPEHLKFIPHVREVLSRNFKEELPAFLEALQTELPPAVIERIKPRYSSAEYVNDYLAAYFRIMPGPQDLRRWAVRRPIEFNRNSWWADRTVKSYFGFGIRV